MSTSPESTLPSSRALQATDGREGEWELVEQPPTSSRSRTMPSAQKASYRKANEMVGMRAKKGRITLVTWKIHQALVRHAQLQHMERQREAAAKGKPLETGSFSMRLSDLVASAHYGSNGLELFKDTIREMQTTLIEWNSDSGNERYWASSQILGTVEIEDPGPPQPTILKWNFPERVRSFVLDPKHYTRMMVDLNENVRTLAGAVLAEIGFRYLTSPAGLSHREDVAWWITALTGRPDREEVEYRYFKRDVLTPALKEVDDIQEEFSLELIEHRRGRKVEELQLRVHRKTQASLGMNEPRNLFDLNLLARIRALGFKEQEAGQLYMQNDEGLLRRTIDAVEERMKNASLPTIDSPAAYFRDALKKGYASSHKAIAGASPPVTPAEALPVPDGPTEKRTAPAVKKSRLDLAADWIRAVAKEAEAVYRTLPAEKQQALRQQFELDEVPNMLPAIARAWAEQGVDSKSAKHTFFKWMATRPPNASPSAEQLLDFSLDGALPSGTFKLE